VLVSAIISLAQAIDPKAWRLLAEGLSEPTQYKLALMFIEQEAKTYEDNEGKQRD
jgi:hypothetical protein